MAGGGVKKVYNSIRGGADGITYTPFVSEDGVLSWTANKSGVGVPKPVRISYTLTEQDKQDIAQIVLQMLNR